MPPNDTSLYIAALGVSVFEGSFFSVGSKGTQTSFLGLNSDKLIYILWMDETLHHIETIVCGYLQRIAVSGFLSIR